ncbi:MAG TPA: hypothetical protein DD490_01775 [Acidobacteria bacterium]|nr:hypothetical protein [Acidobacteriota bacterium]
MGLVALFGAGLAIGNTASAQDVVGETDVDLADTSGSWEFIRKVDHKCVDNGNMDFCQNNNPDLVCKLGIKSDRDGNVLEKKCQN